MEDKKQNTLVKITQLLLLKIKPLWLREKAYYKIYGSRSNVFPNFFEKAKLEFVPEVYLKLMPTDIFHKQIAFCGFYELAVSSYIAKLAKAGSLMVDVGANYGYYSCLWAATNPQNRVIAFEASPRNISPLQNNITNNQLESRVEINDIALGKEVGSLPFNFMSDEQTGWGGVTLKQRINTVDVSVITLDKFMTDNYPNQMIDLLKIDTEGADTWVLQGAESLLRSHKIKHIFFEENTVRMSKLGIKPNEAHELLKDCNYKIERLTEGEWYASII